MSGFFHTSASVDQLTFSEMNSAQDRILLGKMQSLAVMLTILNKSIKTPLPAVLSALFFSTCQM